MLINVWHLGKHPISRTFHIPNIPILAMDVNFSSSDIESREQKIYKINRLKLWNFKPYLYLKNWYWKEIIHLQCLSCSFCETPTKKSSILWKVILVDIYIYIYIYRYIYIYIFLFISIYIVKIDNSFDGASIQSTIHSVSTV